MVNFFRLSAVDIARKVSPEGRPFAAQGKQALALSGTVILLVPVINGKLAVATTLLPQVGVVAVNVAALPVTLMNWLAAYNWIDAALLQDVVLIEAQRAPACAAKRRLEAVKPSIERYMPPMMNIMRIGATSANSTVAEPRKLARKVDASFRK